MRSVVSPRTVAKVAGWPDRHPGVVFLLLILLAAFGIVFAVRLPVGDPPAPASALLHVRADLPGIDSATVHAVITHPLQEAFDAVPGVQSVEARTSQGRSEIFLRFDGDGKRDRALPMVRRRIESAIPRLPVGMDVPTFESREAPRSAAVIYAVTADRLERDTVRWVERALVGPLRELPEVAAVTFEGASRREIVVQPDMRRLATLGLSFDDLIQSLQRAGEAPRRKRGRRFVITPGSPDEVAARAVILPNGESIALGEVARVMAVTRPPVEAPRFGGEPALRLQIFPRRHVEGSYVAERANAHLAWLRANDLVPGNVRIHTLHDQARSKREAIKQLARRSGIFLLVVSATVAMFFGVRRGGLLVSALTVWLPVSTALLWASGLSLNALVVAGLVLACVPFAAMVLLPWFVTLALSSVLVGILAWLLGTFAGAYAPIAVAFAIAAGTATLIAWLLTPWSRPRTQRTPFFTRFLPKRHRDQWRLVATSAMVVGVIVAALTTVYALVTARPVQAAGSLIVQLRGESAKETLVAADSLVSVLTRIPGIDVIEFSGRTVDAWRTQLDAVRMEEAGIRLAEIGRALAVAQNGIVVGQVVSNDEVLPLRLQLPNGVAGDQLERLLLRGEQDEQPAIYLSDIGLMLRETQPYERIEIDGKPAAMIVVRWDSREARDALENTYRQVSIAPVMRVSVELTPAPADFKN